MKTKRSVGRPRGLTCYEPLIQQWLEEERWPEDGLWEAKLQQLAK